MPGPVQLEPEARSFVEATAKPPYLFELSQEEGRKIVDSLQSGPIDKPRVDFRDIPVTVREWGQVPVRIIRPGGATDRLPVILYIHGAGWVFGNAKTHDRLVRLLATQMNAAVVRHRARVLRPALASVPVDGKNTEISRIS